MRRTWLIVATLAGLGASAIAAERPAEQPNQPVEPPAIGSSSSDLGRSGGVIRPPADVDPQMKQMPPSSGDRMPVIPPPGTPGGNPSAKPK
ncbi:MAG TPA: hypothetical protein VJ251_17230 [Stellaceae bacterium]|jgi:hypothetical protein|nr:hypothetical protein [Stellaceae bacterium]